MVLRDDFLEYNLCQMFILFIKVMSRPRVMIRSGAFPDSMEQVECSAVHHLLRDAIKVDEEVTLRKFKQSDLEHLKKLFK